jgi:hypothetical protein
MPVCNEQEAERRARETITARESPDAVKKAIAEIIAGQAVTQGDDALTAKAGGIATRDMPSQVNRRDLYINGDQTWVVANTPGGADLRIRGDARPDLAHGSAGHGGTVTLQSALDQQRGDVRRWADRVPQPTAFCPRCEAYSRHGREKRYCSPACYQRAMAAMVHLPAKTIKEERRQMIDLMQTIQRGLRNRHEATQFMKIVKKGSLK